MARPHLNGADGQAYAESSWTLGAGTLSFSYNDTALPASAYPYQVDPSTTFNVAVSADDKYIFTSGSTYPPTGGFSSTSTSETITVARWLLSTTHYIYNGFVRFDTSSLADDAVVSGATLRVYITAKGDIDNRNFTADYYTWNAATHTDADHSITAQTGALSTDITGLTLSADNDLALSNATANVSKTGYTYLRLHVDGDQPTGSNRISFAAYDHTTQTEPRLIVDYTVGGDTTPPAAPTGLTATVITE